MYMLGRFLTASSPSRTVISLAVYVCFFNKFLPGDFLVKTGPITLAPSKPVLHSGIILLNYNILGAFLHECAGDFGVA
jgi:hypothetical protein